MIDEQFMQDVKDNKHLFEFGISQEIVDEVIEDCKKFPIIPNFD